MILYIKGFIYNVLGISKETKMLTYNVLFIIKMFDMY